MKLKKLCFFVPEFRIWTGQTVLTETDFKLGKDGSLPPKGVLAELGMKNLVDPQTLNIFNAIKRRAVRRLDDAGVPWLNGYAIPLERAKEVSEKLDLEVKAFDEAAADFMNRYEKHVEDWIQANPAFGAELRRAMKPRQIVERRFHAGYVAARLQPLSDEEAESFHREVEGLRGSSSEALRRRRSASSKRASPRRTRAARLKRFSAYARSSTACGFSTAASGRSSNSSTACFRICRPRARRSKAPCSGS